MDKFARFKAAIKGKKRVVITTHLFPDADGIGSQISLAMALREMGIDTVCCNEEPLLERYRYLDPTNLVYSYQDIPAIYKQKSELLIVVDTNTVYRAGTTMVQLSEDLQCPIFYIDHHPCAQHIKNDNCVDTTAAATGELVGGLIEYMGVPFNKEIALPLYTAILIDTSSFRYPSVSANTHLLISKLMATGIQSPTAYNGIYGTKKIEHLHALGEILKTANCTVNEEVAWITLKEEELLKFHVDIEDTHAFINNLLILDNMKVACMFRDDGDSIKVSLRSSGDCDVGVIATALGGGGHSHSAATVLEKTGSTESIIKKTVAQIEILVENQLKSQ